MSETPHDIYFSAQGRDMLAEDALQLTSVGVDIGSATSHLLFSLLELERQDDRYVVVRSTTLHESEILLTPYQDEDTIDGQALGHFIEEQYSQAGLRREDVDTGALILTGVALIKQNALQIAELFGDEAGRFVAVTAGDNLEATIAAHGSGAVAFSANSDEINLSVDIGGGTTKFAICRSGKVEEVFTLDVGARLLVTDEEERIVRLEKAARRIGSELGLNLEIGREITRRELKALASYMADCIFKVIRQEKTGVPEWLTRTPQLRYSGKIDHVTLSGGVSELVQHGSAQQFGDLGTFLAEETRDRLADSEVSVLKPVASIRATVMGASQYTVQVSGSTIYVSPSESLPVRNIPVIRPQFEIGNAENAESITRAVVSALDRLSLLNGTSPVALALEWQGSATFGRIHAFCSGIVDAMDKTRPQDCPVMLICKGDVGGLLGLHMKKEMGLSRPVISIDGIELREFDHIDIGSLISGSGTVPVIIKSLVFPEPEAEALETT